MKTISRAENTVTFTIPDTGVEVTTPAPAEPAGRVRRGATSQAADPNAAEMDILMAALTSREDDSEQHPFEVLDHFQLDVAPAEKIRRRTAPADSTVDIDLDLPPNQNAVLLLEREGGYEWVYPNKSKLQRPRRRRGAFTQSSASGKRVTFKLSLQAISAADVDYGAPRRRGVIKDFIVGKVRGFVLKFVARRAVGALTRRLEEGVKPGPIVINSSTDTSLWQRPADYLGVELPGDRPARILLLVHGTFSSTQGSFGALTAHPSGQAFLAQALSHYDAVLGYDHYTLADTPVQNADELYTHLHKLQAQSQGLQIDSISFSRGGLVYRYLTEQIAPRENDQIAFRRAIFVGCTNAGTQLANQENWEHLINFYTNMVAGATRILGLLSGSRLATEIFNQAVQTLGSLVKYIVEDALKDGSVPGLSAMQPKGSFVKAINSPPADHRPPGASTYYALGSDFEPDHRTDDDGVKKYLALKVADEVMDSLMKEANDLVVHTASMQVIDPVPGAILSETLPFDSNGVIYHTAYFNQPQVAQQCSTWLGLSLPEGLTRRGSPPRPWWPAAVSEDFTVVASGASISDAIANARNSRARYVVVEEKYGPSARHIGIPRGDFIKTMSNAEQMDRYLSESLNLPMDDFADITLDSALTVGVDEAVRSAHERLNRGYASVIVDEDMPIGVVTAPDVFDSSELLEMAEDAMEETLPEEEAASPNDHYVPPGSAKKGPMEEPPVSEGPELVWCHAHAMMEAEAELNRKTTVEVTLSRDVIQRASGVAGGGEARADQLLIVQLIPRKHCEVSGESRLEVPFPPPGEETPLYFDVIPRNAGMGQVDVVIRQGSHPIDTLKLHSKFVEAGSAVNRRATSNSRELQPAPYREEMPDVLYISEGTMGSELKLMFHFESRRMGIRLPCESRPFNSQDVRKKYISDLYKDLEDMWAENRQAADRFLKKIQAEGAKLFDQLFPTELKRLLWKEHKNIDRIQIFSEEPFIPWELLYINDPDSKGLEDGMFLAEMGLVRWHSERNRRGSFPPWKMRLRRGKVSYVIPNYPPLSNAALPAAEDEKKMLRRLFDAQEITPSSSAVLEALSKPGQHDVIHFSCHGLADSDNIWNSELMMEGSIVNGSYKLDSFSVAMIQFANLKNDNEPGPLVFLNACEIGRGGREMVGTGGFAQAFIEEGAGAFIGSHWSVADNGATGFSEALYEALESGSTMTDAVKSARAHAKRKSNDFTWLAYVVYADPDAVFKP